MKTIKIIDLLVRIANGEEVPKKIKYKDEVREYVYKYRDYVNQYSDRYFLFFSIMKKGKGSDFENALNDEVEIIEDTPKEEIQVLSRWYPPKEEKKIEKLKQKRRYIREPGDLSGIGEVEYYYDNNELGDKINEIIDKVSGR